MKRYAPVTWKKIAAWQNHRCYLCGRTFRKITCRHDEKLPDGPTIEHIVPRAQGGGGLGNIAIAHRRCNTRKGMNTPTVCQRLFGRLLAECAFSMHTVGEART